MPFRLCCDSVTDVRAFLPELWRMNIQQEATTRCVPKRQSVRCSSYTVRSPKIPSQQGPDFITRDGVETSNSFWCPLTQDSNRSGNILILFRKGGRQTVPRQRCALSYEVASIFP